MQITDLHDNKEKDEHAEEMPAGVTEVGVTEDKSRSDFSFINANQNR